MAALHEALAYTLPKKSFPTLMTPPVSQYFPTSYKDNALGSPQGSFSAFCASTGSLLFCSICPTRTMGLKTRAMHPASCAAPYVSKGCASWKTIQNGPCWQWEAGEAGRFEEALKGLGKKKSPKCGRESWQK